MIISFRNEVVLKSLTCNTVSFSNIERLIQPLIGLQNVSFNLKLNAFEVHFIFHFSTQLVILKCTCMHAVAREQKTHI